MINATMLFFISLFFLILIIAFLAMKIFYAARTKNEEFLNEQIYIGNLSYRAEESDVLELFSRFGAIDTVRIVRHFKTGQSKGYAFVTYCDALHAQEALSAHGEKLYGRSLVVRIAKPRLSFPIHESVTS